MGVRHRIGWLAGRSHGDDLTGPLARRVVLPLALLSLALGAATATVVLQAASAAAQGACVQDAEPNDEPSAEGLVSSGQSGADGGGLEREGARFSNTSR